MGDPDSDGRTGYRCPECGAVDGALYRRVPRGANSRTADANAEYRCRWCGWCGDNPDEYPIGDRGGVGGSQLAQTLLQMDADEIGGQDP